MLWQDWVLSGGSIVFALALIPSVLSQNKPALATSLLTGTILVIFAIVYATLSLWFAAGTPTVTTSLWFVLAVQKHLKDAGKEKNKP